MLDEAAALLFNNVRTRFLAEMDPDRAVWPESKAAAIRRAKGKGGGTLFDTGNLFRSLQLGTLGEDTRVIGTDVFYGVFHNEGQGQVKRQFLGFGDADVSMAQRVVINRIAKALA